ncbi:MAG: GNAT family N-acetyltransferase [Planctomycetota bacterium]
MNQRLQIDERAQRRMSVEAIVNRLESWLRHDGYRAFVADRGPESPLLGYLLCVEQDDPCVDSGRLLYIRQLYVEPSSRRQGVATAMINRLIADHIPPSMPLEMDVLTSNPAGQAFWHAIGFTDRYTRMRRAVDRG